MKKYSSDAVNLNVGVTNKTAEKVIVEYARKMHIIFWCKLWCKNAINLVFLQVNQHTQK